MLTVYAIGRDGLAFTEEYQYPLDHYADAEILEKELDADFPLGWVVTRVTGLKYVDSRTSLSDLYAMDELLEDEDHGEAFELYVENQLDASYAFDTFWDAYQGEYDDLEDFAMSWLHDALDFEVPSGFRIEWDRVAWECDYTNLNGHIFIN